jgi:hypothetical protein
MEHEWKTDLTLHALGYLFGLASYLIGEFDKRDCAHQTRFEYQRSKGFGTVDFAAGRALG